jgi:enoyl-CoA hydratase/carnithine racemase
MSGPETVRLSVNGPVATLLIDNPPLNVLTIVVRKALLEQIAELEVHDDVRVLVIESAGERAFSVGSDVREFPADEAGGVAKIRFEQMLLDRIAGLASVTIAKIRGMALGGGAELMLACDFRIASADSQIGFPEIRLAALPAAGGMKRLVRELGALRARELVLLGKPVSATRAAELNLINAAVAPAELDAEVDRLCRDLVSLSGHSLRLAKKAIGGIAAGGEADTLEAEVFGALFRKGDLAEGLEAFIQKRPPRFNRE